jgi:hypothetical protein
LADYRSDDLIAIDPVLEAVALGLWHTLFPPGHPDISRVEGPVTQIQAT